MKMTAEHYNILKARLDERIQEIGVDRVKEHRAKKLGKDVEMRFRWDVYAAVHGWSIPELTVYHDTHIDTALKYYFKTTTLLN